MGVKVLKRINRKFDPYAIAIHFSDEHARELEHIWTDGGRQIWLSRKYALKLASDIRRKLEVEGWE